MSNIILAKSHLGKFAITACLLTTIISACAGQVTLPEPVPSKTPETIPTKAPTDTPSPVPSPTPSSTPSPTPTPLYIVRADAQTESDDPATFVFAGNIFDTFDPAISYGPIIQNVYETLVFYDREKPDALVPHLAESWEVSPDGKTYIFHIREGVKFHNGDILTPSDVAYSLQRGLLIGGSDSPQWLFTEPFFGPGTLDVTQLIDPSGALINKDLSQVDPEALRAACERVKSVIVADDTAGTVTMKLAQRWNAFLPALASPAGSIMDAKWIAENNTWFENVAWDGFCDPEHRYDPYATPHMHNPWQRFYAPTLLETPFEKIANGTGPYKLIQWSLSGQPVITLERNEDYWREPANLQKVKIRLEWNGNTILSLIEAGTADGAWVQDDYRAQMEEMVGERCEYDLAANNYKPCTVIDGTKPLVVFSGRPENSQLMLIYNYDIKGSYGNPFTGSAKLDGNGIPSDFFSDVHVRKAFAYCFDWDTFINDAYNGAAVRSTQLLPPGLIGFNEDIPHYKFDLAACEEEFRLADIDKDGIPAGEDPDDIWDLGFQFKAIYTSNSITKSVAEILANNVNSINPKFVITPIHQWDERYDNAITSRQTPFSLGVWVEDIHDPYNWFQPFTTGYTSKWQSLPDDLRAKFREIYDRGLSDDEAFKRSEIYYEASLLYYNEAVGIPLVITTDDYYWQRWVEGIILNPFFPRTYFYGISKK